MTQDRRRELIEDIIEGLVHGEVGESLPTFDIQRVDDGSITFDLGDPDRIYVVTVTSSLRSG
ncbi:hypothetical protein [Aeromicrobium massiliense]|uniref:hypothetical protein n=1 Tax=Aeromicrobium massiliense TaxID=1464554 RepID=UPI00031006E2|nr:hypothetical protein [Aeromicrobium massiliense]